MNPELPQGLYIRADGEPDGLTVRSFTMRASTANDQARTVDAVLASEQPTLVFDRRSWTLIREMLLIDGGSSQFPSQVPLLDTHDASTVRSQLGSTRNIRVEKNELIGTRHFSSVQAGADAFTKVKEGHLNGGSIGYIPRGYADLEPGASYQAGTRTITNDGSDTLRVTFDFVVIEDSVAAIGRDDKAKTRALSPSPTPKESPMTIEELVALYGAAHRALITKLHGEGKQHQAIAQAVILAERASSSPAAPAPAPAPVNGVATPTAQPVGNEVVRAEIMKEERTRRASIREAAGTDMPAELVTRAIDEEWTIGRAKDEFLAEMRRSRGAPVNAGGQPGAAASTDPVEMIASSEDKFMRATEVALMQRAFASQPDRMPKFTTEQISEARSLRGVGLQDLARLSLRAHRQAVPIMPDEIFRRALSTISFPVALGNTLNRVMQQAYETAPSTLLQWASIGSVNDFREHKSIKLGKFARPSEVGRGGQVEHGQIAEEAEGYQAKTYATRLSISRQQFTDDDLGIFDRVVPELGSSMKMNIDDVGYDLLISASGVGPTLDADSKALFATDHVDFGDAKNGTISNYKTGNTWVLGSVGLTELKRMLRVIKAGGRLLNLMPKILLVPAALEQKALEMVNSSSITIGGTSEVRGETNVHAGTVKVIVEPRLDGGTNGTTAWYLICDPIRAKSLQVSFLRGNQSPIIERRDPTDVLGIGWLAYHDVGVDAVDFRGIVRASGA